MEWLDNLGQSLGSWGMSALGGVLLIVVGVILARLARKGLRHGLGRIGLDSQLCELIAAIAFYMVVSVVVIAAFGVMGIETASLITILGTCTLAIGLALQGSLSNFASGIMLLVFRPFRTGDLIETGDYLGHVTDAGVFSTKINTLQNVHVDIPNTYISHRPLENWSTNDRRRLDLEMEVDISGDLGRIKQSVQEALRSDERLLGEPAPFVGVKNFGDTSSRLVIRPWCKPEEYWTLSVELPELIKAAIEAGGGAMPTPRRDILLVGNGPGQEPGLEPSQEPSHGPSYGPG
jgi:small conductance mechanosensitive channel